MASRFVLDSTFVDRLERSDILKDALLEQAQEGERAAKALARENAYGEGAYHDGIEAVAGTDESGKVQARLVAKDFKSHWIEFGTEKMSPRPCLIPGAETIGPVEGGGLLDG